MTRAASASANWPSAAISKGSCNERRHRARHRGADGELSARPRPAAAHRRCPMYRSPSGRGETVSIVGESGSGKTTIGSAIPRAPAGRQGQHPAQRHRHRASQPGRATGVPPNPASDLPGPLQLARSEPDHRGGGGRAAAGGPANAGRIGGAPARGGGPRSGRPRADHHEPLPRRVLRRPAPAHRHRAGPRAQTRDRPSATRR